MARRTIVLLASHGWAVRNYIRSDFLSRIRKSAEVVVLIARGDHELERTLRSDGLRVESLIEIRLPHYLTSLNGLYAGAHNRRLGFWDLFLWEWSTQLDSRLKRPYYQLQRGFSKVMSFSPFYDWIAAASHHLRDRLHLGRLYDDLFDEIEPAVVVSTNPYSVRELPVTLLAKERGVQTIGAVSSWDNLSYMGPLPVEHDYYVVWSETMREDLLKHKPHLTTERVLIMGAPQFDFHIREDLIWSRDKLFARIGGDASRTLITYGGSPPTFFPDEPAFVAKLWEALKAGDVAGRPQLLVRLHPHDNTERFADLKEKCPGLLLSRPWPYDGERFWWFAPELEDIAMLSNTIRQSEVGLSVCSSLALDFAVLGKPLINVSFAYLDGGPRSIFVRKCHGRHHYRRVIQSGAVRLARSFDELLSHLNAYMKCATLDSAPRQVLLDRVCGPVDGQAWKRMADFTLALHRKSVQGENGGD